MSFERLYQPWDAGHPLDGEVVLGLVVHGPDGRPEFSTDDPVEFLAYVEEHYPFVFKSIRLEMATYQVLDDRN